ncbi:MAG TPA: hypothetical protein VK821_12425 [Dehalococcoidia bacterium]|nr:hypothetical protein [Dehalococcoidia bacterium]
MPLLIGLLAGPILWSLHLLVSEILVSSACSAGSRFARFGAGSAGGRQVVLLGVSLAFILAVVAVDFVALRCWRQSRVGIEVTGASGGAAGRSGWMALAGVLLSSFFLIGILFGALPLFWLSGCGG